MNIGQRVHLKKGLGYDYKRIGIIEQDLPGLPARYGVIWDKDPYTDIYGDLHVERQPYMMGYYEIELEVIP